MQLSLAEDFEDFQTSGAPYALKRDATDGVQSVHVEVKHPDEVNTLLMERLFMLRVAV